MGDKSHVGMFVCPICREPIGVVLNKRLKNTLPKYSIDPTEVCEKCREKYLSQGVMLINPETCGLMVIKNKAFSRLFNKPIPNGKIAFIEQQALEEIFELYNGGQNAEIGS